MGGFQRSCGRLLQQHKAKAEDKEEEEEDQHLPQQTLQRAKQHHKGVGRKRKLPQNKAKAEQAEEEDDLHLPQQTQAEEEEEDLQLTQQTLHPAGSKTRRRRSRKRTPRRKRMP